LLLFLASFGVLIWMIFVFPRIRSFWLKRDACSASPSPLALPLLSFLVLLMVLLWFFWVVVVAVAFHHWTM
jgi:hypothetical protein